MADIMSRPVIFAQVAPAASGRDEQLRKARVEIAEYNQKESGWGNGVVNITLTPITEIKALYESGMNARHNRAYEIQTVEA